MKEVLTTTAEPLKPARAPADHIGMRGTPLSVAIGLAFMLTGGSAVAVIAIVVLTPIAFVVTGHGYRPTT